jgi:hypothetical protein
MLAMQYSIHLPHDFDAQAIHNRVAQRKGLFDTLPGMLHKSFLFNEDEHLYAPFYIWDDSVQARGFLIDDLFKGVIESFSRPRVRSWLMMTHAYGNISINPTFGLREADSIPVHENLQELIAAETRAQNELSKNDALYMHALAIDPDRWELIRYSLWKDAASAPRPSADVVQEYQVLHVSEPRVSSARVA